MSSTGHLILIGDWINFESSQGKVFEVVIQLGSILAVMWVFRARLLQLIRGTLTGVPSEVAFTRNLLIAFLPAAVIGGIFIKSIKQVFYHPGVVVVTLVLGGLIMLWVERKTRHTATCRARPMTPPRTSAPPRAAWSRSPGSRRWAWAWRNAP